MKIALEVDPHLKKDKSCQELEEILEIVSLSEATHIVAVGGDGFMLQILQKCLKLNIQKPIYGLNKGSLGFLMNTWNINDLESRIKNSEAYTLNPLCMTAISTDNTQYINWAFNDVYIWRQTHQTAKLSISVDKVSRLKNLIGDGLIVATPAGSTAYNYSAHGPILPLETNLLALSPISPFRPRRWRGALLPNNSEIYIEAKEVEKRPVCAVADNIEIRDIKSVTVKLDKSKTFNLLFDSRDTIKNRILKEQFEF